MAPDGIQDDELLRQQIKAMDPGKFEQLVFELAHREDSAVIRLTVPDGGADTLKPSKRDSPAKVWQAKRYTGNVNWDECEKSLEKAASRFRPSMITFAFARDFSERTEAAFQERLVKLGSNQAIDIHAWTISDLVRRLGEHDDLRVRFFGADLEDPLVAMTRAIKAGGQLESGTDLLERAQTLAEYTEHIDPDFTYAITSSGAEAPAPAWEELPYLTMVVGNEQTRIEIASWPREGAEIHPPTFSFKDDEAGREARRKAMELLARGDEAVVRDGAQVQLSAPKAFHDLASTNGVAQANEVTLFPSDSVRAEMAIRSPLGDLTFDIDLRSIPPEPGAAAAFAGYADTVLVEVNFILLDEPTIRASISMHGSFGEDASTNTEVAHTLLVFNAQTEVSLGTDVLFPTFGSISGKFAGDGLDEERVEVLRARLALSESVLWLEERTGQKIPIPVTYSGEEIAEAEEAVRVLKTGTGRTTFRQIEGEIEDPTEIPHLPKHFADEASPAREPMTAEIFGQTIELGIGEFDLPSLKVGHVAKSGVTAT